MGGHLTNEIIKQHCQRRNQMRSTYSGEQTSMTSYKSMNNFRISTIEEFDDGNAETVGNKAHLSKSANQICTYHVSLNNVQEH